MHREFFSIIQDLAVDYYFQPKDWEKDGKIYERMGIKKVADFVADPNRVPELKTNSLQQTNNYYLKSPTLAQMQIFEHHSRWNEIIHLKGFAMSTGLTALDAGIIHYTEPTEAVYALFCAAGVVLGALAVAELYLVMLQRYNRARIVRIQERRIKNENK
jgi:hypothetical protein